jgi:hypothetical protein
MWFEIFGQGPEVRCFGATIIKPQGVRDAQGGNAENDGGSRDNFTPPGQDRFVYMGGNQPIMARFCGVSPNGLAFPTCRRG